MAQIQGAFCYDGKGFQIVEEDTIVQLGGNQIVLWNVGQGSKDYIPCPRQNGYCAVTTSYNKGLIAAAVGGLQPSCHIYQMPGKRMIAEFPLKTTLKVMGMAFSRDGNYLIIIGGLPDFNISIYDLENKKFLVTEEHKLKYRKDFLDVQFNPRTKNEFCILSEQKIQFYTILPAFQFLDGTDGAINEADSEGGQNFIDAWRYDIQEFDAGDVPVVEGADARVCFTQLTWDSQSRVLLSTNQKKLFHVTSKQPHIGKTLDLKSVPLCSVMTPKHILVSESNGMINWYRIEHPFENAKPEDKFITIFDDVVKEYNYREQLPKDAPSPANHMLYTKSHQNLLIGTTNGFLTKLNVPSEKETEDEEEQENPDEQKQQTLYNDLQVIGRFHTAKVNAVKPLGVSTQMVSISADCTVAIWEVTNGTQLSTIAMPVEPISLDVSREGSVMFIGTAKGTFRIYDITNRERPRLIHQLKFYEDDKPISQILSSEDGKIVLISSQQSEIFFVMSQEAHNDYIIYGQIAGSGYIQSINYFQKDGKPCALAVLSNNLIENYSLPTDVFENRLEPMPHSATNQMVRKCDPGSDMMISNMFTSHYMVSGDDNILKCSETYPSDAFDKIDWKKPAVKPSIELKDSHSLGLISASSNEASKNIVTGGKDGMINVRSADMQPGHDKYECLLTFSAHPVCNGGVIALAVDREGQFVYSAGGDGSIFIHSLGHASISRREIPFENEKERSEVTQIRDTEPANIADLQTVTDRLIVEFQKTNELRKKNFRNEIMKELNQIKENLRDLLDENERVTDIEKLDRDEFVIDVVRKANLEKQGDDLCSDIRKKCEVTSLTMMLLKERCTQQTWDQMDVHSKACKSIQSEKLIYNYAIRKRTPQEYRLLSQLILQRKIELKQKLDRMERKMAETLDEAEFCGFENYLQNRVSGKPEFLDDDSIAEAARIFEETRARKLKEKNDKLNNVNMNQMEGNGKLKPILTITKGKLGTKTRKRDPDEEARLAALAAKGQQRDIKGMEEIHWKIIQTQRSIDDIKSALENPNIFDLLYEPYDLFRDKRKRAQIEFLKEVVFELKRDFNKEFAQLEKYKNDHIFAISEKNEQIRDLLESLQEPIILEKFEKHLAERPEHIFEIDEKTEITVERYFNAQQRAEMEEAERKRQEKEALLQGDNIGQRGLKTMIGGNELIFKKEKNKLEDEFVREEWMDKPEEEMNEDEKIKLKEFQQRLADSKEKQRKQWQVNLQRVKQEIVEIKIKFEEQLFSAYKKRVFFDARIHEQELQIVRLTIALHDVKETAQNVVKYRDQFIEKEKVLEEKKEFVHICNDQYAEYDQKQKNDKAFAEQEVKVKAICGQEDLEPRKILNFIKTGRANCKVTVPPEKVDKMKSHLIDLDPYYEIDAELVNQEVVEMEKQEVYDFERDRHHFAEVLQQQFENIVQERQIRIRMKKIEQKNQERLGHLRDFIHHLERDKKDIVEGFENIQVRFRKSVDRQEKLKFNFEVLVYMKQGQVEVPQLPVATDYKDAILVNIQTIGHENSSIQYKGNNKVHNMEEILKHNTRLKQIKYEVKRYTLQIEDYKERALDVQLYRVTKKTQEIIQGKYQKKDEEDKKRLESQIKQLEQNSTNRLKTFSSQKKKLLQEIKDKQKENDELESKARELRMEVDQRQQIIDLKSATNNDTASDPRKKFMDAAKMRKMVDVIRQQEEEIMFLKDELDRLRARTFPSFAHIQNKADYPDER